MISYVLLIVSVIMVVIIYFSFLVNRISNIKRRSDDYTGFDVAKEVTTDYDVINIVRSNDIMISEYDIKRNVIRLNNSNYEGDSYWDIIVASLLAGYSLVNSENPNNFKFSFILKRIRIISFVPMIMVLISYFVNNIGDAKIGLVVFILLVIYQYMRYQIAVSANEIIKNNLRKELYEKLENSITGDIRFNMLAFVASLVMILRLVIIILGM